MNDPNALTPAQNPPGDGDNRPMDRRKLFRQGLRRLLTPLEKSISPLEAVARQIGALENRFRRVALTRYPNDYLRPPGALPEQSFLDTCSRCGICVRVCPAQCIKIDATAKQAGGAPFIQADTSACVVCDGRFCMYNCPSGALLPTPLKKIDMGTAKWEPSTCVRRNGDDCQRCVDACPLGSAAIELKGDRIHVIEPGCIGCGMCQEVCPTVPKSIFVVPVRRRDSDSQQPTSL
jgi:ferredoxin-type protein NapG